MRDLPIGMFDSGLGGLTVMQQLVCALPYEDVVYFGDTARLPYGGKSPETILRYSIENSIFLVQKNVKMIVVACNTATAHALEQLQRRFPIPVVGVIEPGVESALKVSRNRCIGVLGTKGTVLSRSYEKAILERNPHAKVFSVACPLFVPIVEEGFVDHLAARLIVKEYLAPLKEQQVDTLLLGCTHYPLLKELIRSEMGDGVEIIDSACSCANRIQEVLSKAELVRMNRMGPVYRYYVSDDPERFQDLGSAFLGMQIHNVESSG